MNKSIAITGGIACGKTSVIDELTHHFPTSKFINMDTMWAEYKLDNQEIIEKTRKMFGDSVFENGILSKRMLSKAVFMDVNTYLQYNSMVLPYIHSMENKMREDNSNLDVPLFVEATTLFEHNLQANYHVVCVSASSQVQLERLIERNSLSEKEAKLRISVQIPLYIKMMHSDIVFWNDDYERNNLPNRVASLATEINRRFLS